jgi:hypothetical protein
LRFTPRFDLAFLIIVPAGDTGAAAKSGGMVQIAAGSGMDSCRIIFLCSYMKWYIS